jgi:hypothetical protein
MASILLLEDYKNERGSFKKGEIISVPFLLATQLKEEGICEHPIEVTRAKDGKTTTRVVKEVTPAQAGLDQRDIEIADLKLKLEQARAHAATPPEHDPPGHEGDESGAHGESHHVAKHKTKK